MNNPYLLSGKFISPKPPEICAPRHSLITLFNKESDKRIIFVSAPAGYGKTVSAQLWLKKSGRTPLWIGLDEYDNTPSVFYKLFCTGVLSIQPGNKAMADILSSPSFAMSPVEHAIRFLSEFIPDNKQYAVVFDDMHLVTNEEIRKSALLAQKRLPASFILLVLTRNEVAPEYFSIAGEDKCAVITARDLAFSPEEIQGYFSDYGHSITAEEAAAVYSTTRGWAIGINALAMSGQIDPGQKGGEILDNYIKTHIWNNWDDMLRVFLLKTAAVDEMPAELCRRLTGREDSEQVLANLYRSNSFVSRTPENIYRYHHLFVDFLRRQPLYDIDVISLYKKATEYYYERGEYFTARRYAAKCGDIDFLLSILHQFSQYRSASMDEFVNFSKMYAAESLPESICDEAPFLYAAQMWENYLLGNAAQMEYYMDKVYQFLPEIAIRYPQYLETVMMQITLDHRVPLTILIDRLASLPPIEHLHESQQGATLTHEFPWLHRGNRDYYELIDEKLRGKLAAACRHLFKGHMDMFLAGIESGLLLEQNLVKEATEAALRTKNLENEKTGDELCFSAFVHLAESYYAAGNPKWAVVMEEAEDYINKNGAYYLMPNFLAYKTKVLLWDSDKAAASSWLGNYFVTTTEKLEFYKIYQHFTTARAYMVLAQTDKAMSYLLKLKQLGEDFRRPTDIAEAQVLQAVLEWASGLRKEGLETLETAMTAMQEYGFIRVFAAEGAAVLPMLKRLALSISRDNYPGSLNPHFLKEIMFAAYEQSKRHKGIAVNIRASKPVKLSKQQRRIITLLSQGYRNAEIAEITGLTIHTVKSHCAAAYVKLNVNNAMDAVLKAKDMGLLD